MGQDGRDEGENEMSEMEKMRIEVAARIAAALLPEMMQHNKWEICRRALEITDALIDMALLEGEEK